MGTLSEAYRDHPLHLHHIVPLDFKSVSTVPESHVWPHSEEFSSGEDRLSVPLIDFRDPNATKIIRHACETWGAFQLINHGIPFCLVEEVEAEARRLFSLPAHLKMKALRDPGGATGYGIPRIAPFFNKHMWHEGFTVMDSAVDHAKQLWPKDYSRFCDTIENYQKKMKVLAEQLTQLIFDSLNVTKEEMNWVGLPFTALQLNSYPSCPDPSRAMGLAPHTDTSLITILHQSTASGLQIFKEGAGWVPVPPIAGALVVNAGDILHVLSNGQFRNVLHRVIVNKNRCHRLSVAYFYGPPVDFSVRPLVKVLKSGQVPRYRPVTVKEYAVMKATSFEKALSLIRI